MKQETSEKDIEDKMLLVHLIDENTLNNNTVTVRDRDTMKQITISVDELIDYISSKVRF